MRSWMIQLLLAVQAICAGAAEMWRCGSGEEISTKFLCDEHVDCMDKSDETVATCGQCPEFTCATGSRRRCLGNIDVCDRNYDCDDGSDEDNCFPSTTATTISTTTSARHSPTSTRQPDVATRPDANDAVERRLLMRKCKRNPSRKPCARVHADLAAVMSKKLERKCAKKPTRKNCKRWRPVLERFSTCSDDPRATGCASYWPAVARLPDRRIKKCARKPTKKKCRKFKPVLDIMRAAAAGKKGSK